MNSKAPSESDVRIYNPHCIHRLGELFGKIAWFFSPVPVRHGLKSRSDSLSLIAVVIQYTFKFSCRSYDFESCVAFES